MDLNYPVRNTNNIVIQNDVASSTFVIGRKGTKMRIMRSKPKLNNNLKPWENFSPHLRDTNRNITVDVLIVVRPMDLLTSLSG